MTSENSATKWIVGCLVAGVAVLFLCGGAVVLVGVWGYGRVKQVAQTIGPEIEKQMAEMQFATEWRPPAPDAGADQLFPESIGAWVRVGNDDSAAIPELAIEKDGLHGAYESAGTTVDVYVYRLPVTEKTPVFNSALSAIEAAGYASKSHTQMDFGVVHWLTFSFAPPERHGRMWWAGDWLVVTITDNAGVDLESFERDYVLAIQGPPLPGMEDPMPLEEFTPSEPAEPSVPEQYEAPAEPESAPADPDAAAPVDPSAQDSASADPDNGNE